ncbi:MAG: ribosomal-protein-alanine acetyltransferase [Acidobacteria bacterium]|nr:ribosomal-protein-alanine acetyltransferase [Acidobacteriota bacterium]
MIRIRPCALADLDVVRAIAAAAPEAAGWSRETYATILQDPQQTCCYIADQEGTIVGFVCLRVMSDEAEVLNLAVLPSTRRLGVGSRLLDHALREAVQQGAHRVFLEVRETNQAALALYYQFGFAVSMRRVGYYSGPPADALVLVKDLSGKAPSAA